MVHHTTALFMLRKLAADQLMSVQHSTFRVEKYPQPVWLMDVKEAFSELIDHLGFSIRKYNISYGHGVEVYCDDKVFEKLFGIIYVEQKLFPVQSSIVPVRMPDGSMGRELSVLFIGAEKTQVRQIPLVQQPPWPWRFLLELGGMIVIQPVDKKDALKELRQFLENHPQFRVRVAVHDWPDGGVAIYTWWFERLSKRTRRDNDQRQDGT